MAMSRCTAHALHDDTNTIPTWLQEAVSSYVSVLNDRSELEEYLIDRAGEIESPSGPQAGTGLRTRADAICREADPVPRRHGRGGAALRDAGLDDGAILEANQIICYFNYVNRSINGLGVTTAGDIGRSVLQTRVID